MLTIQLCFFVSFLALSTRIDAANTCEAFLDLTLIIDSSGSVPPADFEQGKQALLDLVSRLNVGADKAGVAVINYASTVASLHAESDVYQFEQIGLLQRIADLPQIGTLTATGDALALAKSYCDARCRPLAQAIPRVFVIFTDGHSNVGEPPIPIAQAIRDVNTEGIIFAVGIGNIGSVGQAELEGIAGDPSYVMNIASYLDLARVTNAITTKMCEFPAFVLPDVRIQGQATGNNTRYYRMRGIKKNAFYEIQFQNRAGQSRVYTSTTNKKPTARSINLARAGNTITTYVPADAKGFYFAVQGATKDLNQFDFIVRVRSLGF